jgi:GST-like protein
MLDVYFWTTPNGYKVLMLLEEAGLEYRIKPLNISIGEQFEPGFLEISPNNRMPALVDHAPSDGGTPMSVFESGAILEYLADKCGRFLPKNPRARFEVLQWLYWQVAGLGPMAGQNHHFTQYAPAPIYYAIDRYVNETARLYAVLNERLADREFVAGDYSIADMACYPWIGPHERQLQDLDDFPNLNRWFGAVAARPATVRAYAKGSEINTTPTVTQEAKKLLFGQAAHTVRRINDREIAGEPIPDRPTAQGMIRDGIAHRPVI